MATRQAVSWAEDPVGGTADGRRAPVQDVGVNHRRAHVAVAEQLLNGSDVVSVLEQVRRERMAQGVGGWRAW